MKFEAASACLVFNMSIEQVEDTGKCHFDAGVLKILDLDLVDMKEFSREL
jgi:hypothetical protein